MEESPQSQERRGTPSSSSPDSSLIDEELGSVDGPTLAKEDVDDGGGQSENWRANSSLPAWRKNVKKRQSLSVYNSRKTTFSQLAPAVMRAAIPLISDQMEWADELLQYLDGRNGNFMCVGVLGPQGVGKSTFLSMLGGNSSSDMYRQYKFRPESKECAESAWYQTSGIHAYVTSSRLILLDSQPLLSAAVMRNLFHHGRKGLQKADAVPQQIAQDSMHMAAFMLQVCHLVFIMVDHLIDVDLLHFLTTSETLKPAAKAYENFPEINRLPHVVFVQHKGRCEDFQMVTYLEKSAVLSELVSKSCLNCFKQFTMPKWFLPVKRETDCDVNLIILPNLKPRGYASQLYDGYKAIPEYNDIIADLKCQIANLRRQCIVNNVFVDERSWYNYAAKIWTATKKSSAIAYFARHFYG